ncbi:MAG: dienelactone hydrolase family protein [Candidatus Omnitrophica bacterium]|nr:dienelactone hydrolase family protein [Candidatus Omnitrophota bacterium]
MRFLLNLLLIIVIIGVVGGMIKRIQDNRRAQELAAQQPASDPEKPAQFTDEQWDIIKQANSVPDDVTPLPTLSGSPSKILKGRALYQYICYLPHGYSDEENKARSYPLIVFLHGQDLKGDDLDRLYQRSPIQDLQMREDPNFILAAPLCPANGGWVSTALDEFLEHIIARFNVDQDRLYLTGISMGGHGAWSWAQDFPKRFAAIAPLCGAGNPQKAKLRLKRLPIWIFHGGNDAVVPVERALSMIHALEPVNANLRYSIFPEQGHNIGGVYQRPELYVWFLTHSKDPKKSLLYQDPESVAAATETISNRP